MATAERQEVQAVAKWVRMSPRKARLVVDHIRGRSVPEARTVLAFTQRAAAREIEKVLHSAVANAEANHDLDGDQLVVSSVYVDEGPVLIKAFTSVTPHLVSTSLKGTDWGKRLADGKLFRVNSGRVKLFHLNGIKEAMGMLRGCVAKHNTA